MNTNQNLPTEHQAAHFVALANALGTKHYGMSAAEFGIYTEEAFDCIQNQESVLDVLNLDAQKYDLERIDLRHLGSPSKAALTEEDLSAAEALLSSTSALE